MTLDESLILWSIGCLHVNKYQPCKDLGQEKKNYSPPHRHMIRAKHYRGKGLNTLVADKKSH